MSTHRKKIYNPIFGLQLQTPFTELLVRYLIKDGKKALAVRLVNEILRTIDQKILDDTVKEKISTSDLLLKVASAMLIRVNFVKRRSGARTHRVPYHLDEETAFRFSLKKLYKLSLKRKERGVVKKIAEEVWNIFKGDSSSVLMTEKNRMYSEAKSKRSLAYMISRFKVEDPERLRIDLSLLKND